MCVSTRTPPVRLPVKSVAMAAEETLTGTGGISATVESLKTNVSGCALGESFESKIENAFKIWSAVSNITFTRINEPMSCHADYRSDVLNDVVLFICSMVR